MRLFVDSRIFFSIYCSNTGGTRELAGLAIQGHVELVVSDYVFEETMRNYQDKAACQVPVIEFLR